MTSSFWVKANDLNCRALPHRLGRRLRAYLRRLGGGAVYWADDPRVWRAWMRGWEPAHYLRLLRWRDQGFTPLVVYDIGAHMGLWSEMAQRVFEPRQCVLFEPQPAFHAIAMARRPHTAANWRLMPCALGDKAGAADLFRTRNQAASSLLRPIRTETTADLPTAADGVEPVQVRPLDELVESEMLPRPDLVKIDVQGFEAQVLSGGLKTLRHAQRAIVEVSLHTLYQSQPLIAEILPALTDLGFVVDDLTEAYSGWPDLRLWQVDLWLRRVSHE
jgi:FkbM family methyltransferase